MPTPQIREAAERDLNRLRDLERLSGEMFRAIGMAIVADDEPAPVETLRGYAEDGRAWVATDLADTAIGYLLLDIVDGHAHIEQVSIDPGCAGQGIGRALIEHAVEWARSRSFTAMTLTTFADVPWNGPYYERLGFHRLPADDLTPGLAELRRHEAEHGLDAWPRLAMRREIAERGATASPGS
jgi:GNAT superfamily N-acetyltransferase